MIVAFLVLIMIALPANSQPLADYSFKSPSFNGIGYSSHMLTIENLEHTRHEQIKKEIQAGLDKIANEAKSTNLSKFLNPAVGL